MEKNTNDEPMPKIAKITNFAILSEDSIGSCIARMTALDGLPFSVFITSTELRKSLTSRGFEVPKSKETIKAKFLDYSLKCKQKTIHDISNIKDTGLKFSLTFDEWTSTANKRYINVMLHSTDKLFNLGLVRIIKSATAVICIRLLEQRLNDFGVSLSDEIVGFTTDGASTMQKIGKIIAPKQQLCLAHGIHLAVLDVFYKPNEKLTVNELSSSEDDEIFDSFDFCIREMKTDLTDRFHISTVIGKVRKISKIFRKSPTKNEILQKYVKEEKGKELKLILDCKTRWNTLFDMCQEGFNRLKGTANNG